MEGKEVFGVVRKAVIKDKNGGKDFNSLIKDGAKCYLYIDYIDEEIEDRSERLKTIMIEDVYYSTGSTLKLKYVNGKWQLLNKIMSEKGWNVIDELPRLLSEYCLLDYSYFLLRYGGKIEDIKSAVLGISYGELDSSVLEQNHVSQEYGESITRDNWDLFDNEQFPLRADSEVIDFFKLDYCKILRNMDRGYMYKSEYDSGQFESYLWRSIHQCSNNISYYADDNMDLKKWIGFMWFIFEEFKDAHIFIGLTIKDYGDYPKKAARLDNLIDMIYYLYAKNLNCTEPIYTQTKEKLKHKMLVLERKSKQYREKWKEEAEKKGRMY